MARLTIENCAAQQSPGRLMRRIDKLMASFVESRFDTHDVSFQQWVALKVIRDGVARSAGELARELGNTTGATTRLIDVLEARGLLERDRGSADRRVVQLVLTEEGEASILALQPPVVDAWNKVLADFEQSEIDALVVTLIRLLAVVERVTGAETTKELAE
ncbi:MAG TPA: MarR family transcriptional regulator [Sphingomonas sp.]|nr:MarR family transcriptional regulator [Sphingomonas sp.]